MKKKSLSSVSRALALALPVFALIAAAAPAKAVESRKPLRQAQGRPNIIFFLVDDMGQRDAGCFGSSFYETPAIYRFPFNGKRL